MLQCMIQARELRIFKFKLSIVTKLMTQSSLDVLEWQMLPWLNFFHLSARITACVTLNRWKQILNRDTCAHLFYQTIEKMALKKLESLRSPIIMKEKDWRPVPNREGTYFIELASSPTTCQNHLKRGSRSETMEMARTTPWTRLSSMHNYLILNSI